MRFNRLIQAYLVVAITIVIPSITLGANVGSIDPAYSVVVNSSTFRVKVVVTGAANTGSYYVTVSMVASGGFSVKTGEQSISRLKPGESKTLEFNVSAPSKNSNGYLSVTSKWSNIPSGKGTVMTSTGGTSISSNAGWKVSVQLQKPKGVLAGDPTTWTVSNSWRYVANQQSKTAPYYVTFTIPGVSATYSISGQWGLLGPFGMKYPAGDTKTVTISKSGTVLTF
jgi:hypothetical protein